MRSCTAYMKGQLSEHPLAELIREIAAADLSGALRLARERVKAVVYFEAGEVIYATSNLRLHRLSECVRRWGVVTKQQLAAVPEGIRDVEFGLALVATGALSQQALEELFARQVADVLRPALLWTDGVWDFDPRVRLVEEVRVKLETEELLIMGARRLPAEFIASRFKDDEKLSPTAKGFDGFDLSPTEAFVLSRVDAPIHVHELTAISGLPEADTLQAIYALALGGFLERDHWPSAFTKEEISKAQAIKAALAKTVSAPTAAVSKQVKEESLKTPTATVTETPDERVELEALFARLGQATDYYQILGVGRSAGLSEIKRTYHSLARRFHPDRFRHEAGTPLYARIENAFAQIAQAYDVLKEAHSRDAYNVNFDAQQKKAKHAQDSNATKRGD